MLKLTAIALAASLTSAISAPASAAMMCEGPYQIIEGRLLATQFCQDNYLAKVARSYGMRVSARQVRWDASIKADACRLTGHDNRVRTICRGEFNDYFRDRGGRR